MKDKLLNSIKASWPYLLTLIIGLYSAEILAGSVMALSRYKLTFADHMPTVLKQLASGIVTTCIWAKRTQY